MILTLGFLTPAFAANTNMKTLKVGYGVSAQGQKCIDCHAKLQPGIVAGWSQSRHAHVGISCIDCHQVSKDSPLAAQNCPGVKGTDVYVTLLVTPKVCARCHTEQVKQFDASGHYRARLQYTGPNGRNFKGMTALIAKYEGQGIPKFKHASEMTGCMQCHGSKIKLDANREPVDESWPTSGIGTIWPDGSVGNCTVCHTAHRFSLAEARKPAACAACHLGPDHPDFEIYKNSKHGQIYETEASTWNFTAAPGTWQPGDYRTPTCAVCHMSGIGNLKSTHNIDDRLKWNLWAPESKIRNSSDPLSPLTGNGVAGRKKMEEVCNNCHSPLHTTNFFKQADLSVELYNQGYFEPALTMKKALAAKHLLKANPWADEFQRIFFHLWHHEGRRMRQGATMAGPDYAHWHGVFVLQQDLFKLKTIYNKRMKTGKIED
jgi:hypothetical protein